MSSNKQENVKLKSFYINNNNKILLLFHRWYLSTNYSKYVTADSDIERRY